jgi:uncharacterized membrane protein YuzA (DUF378 family)
MMDHKMLIGWVVGLAAVNYGLVGLFNVNLVEALPLGIVVTKVIYVLIGLAGVYKVYHLAVGKKK